MKQYHMYFEGRGELLVHIDNYDDAMDTLLETLANAGIDFEIDLAELRDDDGNEVE